MKIEFIAGMGLGVLILCLGCNGTSPVAETISDSRPDEKIKKIDLHVGPSGELLSGLAAPPPIGEKDKAPDGILEPEATGRSDLLDAARKALLQNRAQDAVAISDVLVLINPGDMEVLELRGRALIAQGNEESGRTDLGTCCAAGRKSCCP
jgi:hypothetical protein